MPDIESLRQHMQRLAALAAVFTVNLGEPQFVFVPRWSNNQQVAMNINGSGDELYLHFTRYGCFINGVPLSDQQMLALNPSAPIHAIRKVVHDTGYPIAIG